MPAVAQSDLAALLKEMYPYGLEPILYEDCTLAGMLSKANDFVGEAIRVPVKFGPGNKASADFAEAQTYTGPSSRTAFLLTDSFTNYGVVQIERSAIKRCRDAGAIKAVVQDESDSVLYALRKQMAGILYGTGTGSIGRIQSGGGGATITLTNADDIIHFDPGMRIRTATGDGTGAVASSEEVIESVDRIAGTITFTASTNGVEYANGNYLYQVGNYNAVASGLGAWIPASDPTSTPFRGVDRTQDIVALSGVRMTAQASDATIGRALVRAVSTVGRFGGKPDTVILGTTAFQQFVQELEDKVVVERYAKMSDGTDAKIGYTGMAIVCGKHKVTVVEDTYNPAATAWVLSMPSWKIHAVPGGWPGLIDDDGNSNLRMPTSDAFEWRYVAEWDLCCNAPGHNGRMDLTSILA
ncbi:MAG: hypothetical protein IPH07_23475 [Deltaproteobacteria bacterium]|nr:hypothetical protein [Deltaproteobacteria bacterium]MBK8241732.1 hypothetical protein [Deltaproteobacteria bacterium]